MKIKKHILTLSLILATAFGFAQTPYKLNYPDITVGNKPDGGKIVLNGSNVQFPRIGLGSATDSVLTIVNGVIKKVPRSQFSGGGGLTYTAGYGLNLTATEFKADTALIASKSFVNTKVSKEQRTIYLNDYTDEYTGINATTKHNEGSAIVKAYNLITDTTKHYTIYFDANKTYFPTGFNLENGSYWKKPNISFIGTKPKYAPDGKSLISGSVILGTFACFANNLYFDGIGIDAGFTYCSNYGFADGTEAFIPSFNPDQSETVERTNIVAKNIVTLCKPNAVFHGMSTEFANGVILDNITSLYGYHGQVIKSKNVLYTNGFAYGHNGEGLIIKSDYYAVSSNVSVDGLIVGTLPYGVNFLEDVPHRMGVLINPQTEQLYNIKINNVTINGYLQGVRAFGDYTVNGLQIDNVISNNCRTAILNELPAANNIQIGKLAAIGTGGSDYGYVQINGNYSTTIQSISLKSIPYGVSVSSGQIHILSYMYDGGVVGIGAFDISGTGNVYVGTTGLYGSLNNRNVGSKSDQPLPQFSVLGSGMMKNNTNGIPSIAVAGTDYITPSAISNFLPRSAGSTNALTGTLYIDRANTNLGSQVILSTALSPDWYFGTDIAGTGTKSDFGLYNFATNENVFNISRSTNKASFKSILASSLIGENDSYIGVDSSGTLKRVMSPDLSNYTTINTSQTITGNKNFTGYIRASLNDGDANTLVRNVDLGNYVTTNTAQSISGTKTFTSAFYVDRPNTTLGSQIILSTSSSPDWYFGTDISGGGTQSDFGVYNFGNNQNAFNISRSNNAIRLLSLSGTGDRPVFAGADGTLKIGNNTNAVSSVNGRTGEVTGLAEASSLATGQTIGANTTGSADKWGGQTGYFSNPQTGQYIFWNGTNFTNKTFNVTSPITFDNNTGTWGFNGSGYMDLTTDQTATGNKTFTNNVATGGTLMVGASTGNNMFFDNSGTGYMSFSARNNGSSQGMNFNAAEFYFNGKISLPSGLLEYPSFASGNFVFNNARTAGTMSFQNNGVSKLDITSSAVAVKTLTTAGSVQTNASGVLTSIANTGTGTNVLSVSPALTGTPTATTPSQTSITANQIATTSFTGVRLNFITSGTGSATTISVPHGLTGVTASSFAIAQAKNAASSGISYVTTDVTNINIFYSVAPPAGTNNLYYSIEIRP